MMLKRKAIKIFFVLLFMSMLSNFYCVNAQPLIYSISTSQSGIIAAYGSIQGGTYVYIQGSGFSTDASENKVKIGPYACNLLADGAQQNSLTCQTTRAYDSTQRTGLSVSVEVAGASPVTCSASQCKFSYTDSYTPFIEEVYPRTTVGDQEISVWGIHRITDPGDERSFGSGEIRNLWIDDKVCSRLDVTQEDDITKDSRDYIRCKVFKDQEAGEYTFTEHVFPGYAAFDIRTIQTSLLTGKNYTERVAPTITSLPYHVGGSKGHEIEISGVGFAKKSQSYTCKIAGQDCTVKDLQTTKVTVVVPPLDPANTAFGALAKDAADTQTQTSNFLGSNGFKYTRYTIADWKTTSEWLTVVRGANTLVVQANEIKTQLRSPEYLTTRYLEYWRGYFYAPVAGQYRFAGTVDDAFRVQFSSVQNSANLANLQDLIFSDAYSTDNFNPYTAGVSTAIANKTLTQGYYYMQIVNFNWDGKGDFRVMVDMPQVHTYTANPTWQVDEVVIAPQGITPQIVQVKITKAAIGSLTSFSMVYFETATVFKNTSIPYKATADRFRTALYDLPYYGNYDPVVTLITKDSSGAVTSTPSLIDSYTYRITYQRIRPSPSTLVKQFSSNKATFTRVQNHSKPVTGTYGVSLGSDSLTLWSSVNSNYSLTALPYNTQASALQDAFNRFYQTDRIRVKLMKGNDFDLGIKWVVEYVGLLAAPYLITVNTAALKGGNNDLFTATHTVKREFSSTRPLYTPVPFDFLRTAQTQPQLHLKVNNIPAVCSECSYAFDQTKTPAVTASSLSGTTLSLTITNPGSVTFALSDIKITLNGVRCNSLAGTLPSITCQFPSNTLGNAALPAGTNKPIVHIAPIGYADTSSISAISIPLTVSAVTPNKAGSYGGIVATITGTGFPISNTADVTLTLCGNAVTKVTSVSNQQIIIQIPKAVTECQTTPTLITSTLTVNSITQTIPTSTFNYDANIAPVVSSISKTSSSPIVKSSLTVTGSKFTNLANTKVFLVNSTGARVYELTVTAVTSTEIQCILGGGRSGAYNVVVVDSVAGQSETNANTLFNYELIVDSVSPQSGSLGGGYDITITGRNFGTADTHTVFVGNAENMVCTIKTATATQIVCTVPRIDPSYNSGTNVTVVVTARLLEESVCKGDCNFAYNEAVTNNVTVPTLLQYASGANVTITGTDLSGATVMVGKTPVTLLASSATSLTFAYPALKYGSYEVFILTPTGYTHPAITTKTSLKIVGGISRSSGGLNGHRLTVATNGFPSTVDKYLAVNLICTNYSTPLQVISVVPDKITFEAIPSAVDQACKINVTYETNFVAFGYNYRSAQNLASTVVQGASNTYTITSSGDFSEVWFQYINSENAPTNAIYPATITKTGSTTYTVVPTAGYLPNGKFRLLIHSIYRGYHSVTPSTFTKTWASNPTFTAISSSFVGGKLLSLTGAGFITQDIQSNEIYVCGLRSTIKQATTTSLTLTIPPLVTTVTQGLYSLAKPKTIVGTLIGDTPDKTKNIIDEKPSTYYSSNNANCFVGFDYGSSAKASIEYIKYMPNPAWARAADKLEGAKFQGSNDNSTWTTIFTIDTNQVHSGWNYWAKATGTTVIYQFVRFVHTNVSKCQLADIQVNGIVYSNLAVTAGVDKQCDVVIKGLSDITLANVVTYSHAKTSTITGFNPKFGPSIGGTVLTITGTNFGSALSVKIDGIDCPISANTATSITCTTGVRASIPPSNSFVVTSDGNPVLLTTDPYIYLDRWSSQDTWGGESIPREGDSVYVPKGMSLLVDVQKTPVLDAIIVQGKIIFSDQKDMTLDAHYFIISGGQFTAGTQTNRYQHKLTITLHGGYYDKQLPIFGNKVLGCRNCKFSLHGELRTPTWTQLKSTIEPGATQFQLIEAVDWRVGEKIVVASTSFDHYEAEEMTIDSVSANKTVITVKQTFKYRHYAAVEIYDGVEFPMRAQVGLLTRNIKIQGNEQSADTEYGSHMMMNGKKSSGLVASFSYAEFTRCGQPRIIGRYCTHFHMTGEMPESSVRGLAVHHSYARVLTIHGTHFLLVEKNVGYHVKGHNIFIEDGIETNNAIQDNLIISSITSLTLLQSDTSVASYWITNPYNTVRRNHAAGSDFYGFWYEIKQHPDGPSSTSDICPMGMQVGESKDNVAHSNVRFGLRIFKLSARKFPCTDTQLDYLLDPYSGNVAIESVFDNYTLWKNAECGFLGEELGYTTIQNFKTADSKKGGMQFHKTNYTKELVVAKNSIIVGYSQGNKPANVDVEYKEARGFIASRTDGLKGSGLRFYNFGPTMQPLQSCSECFSMKLWVVGSKTTMFENISYTNVTGNYIFWQKWRREIFIDLDGTLLAPLRTDEGLPAQLSGSITPYRASVMIPGACKQITNKWNHSTYCDSTVSLRSILFTNAIPEINFNAINIKAHLLNQPYDDFLTLQPAEQTFSQEYMIIIKKSKDIKKSWAMPFAVGKYYNIHWKWGIDFTHLAIAPSRLWNETEGVVLRFNYTDQRELFEIGKWYKAALQLPFIVPSSDMLSPTNCTNGEYFHNSTERYLFVCVSGRNKAIHEWIDVNGIRCRYNCPQDNGDGTREDAIRLWSDTKNWPGNVLPQEGDNVTIPFQWKMVVNVAVPKLNYIEINGILMFDIKMNHTFEAHYIWVRKGALKIGSPEEPYLNQAKIVLHGEKDDEYLVLDQDASGNKMLAVTGQVQFYGKKLTNIWSKLKKTALVGDTNITVASTADWEVGDKIVLAPTYSSANDDEVVEITAIDGNVVSFTPALKYEHYGASSPITNQYGVLDTRGAVGLLTRNIKITKGPDANGWGCRILAYSYADIPQDLSTPAIIRTGRVAFNGVEIDGCGQYDTTYSALRLQRLGKYQENSQKPTIITSSSIHNSNGMGIWIANSTNIKLDNNVLYWAKKFLVYAEFVNNYTVTNNVFIGAKRRPEVAGVTTNTVMVDDVACYEQFQPIDFATDNVTVTKNLCQGSDTGEGFVFPFAPCDKLDTYNFGGNTAGSCTVAFMFHKLQGFECIGASQLVGYASQIGLMANPSVAINKMVYSDVIFADNERGITLRYGHDVDDNTMVVRNSYFAGFSRPDCPTCYGADKISFCNSGYAVRMFAATITGEGFPLAKKNTGFDVICTRQAYDMKSFFDNVTFENYRTSNAAVPYCKDMSVFRRHNIASDNTGSAYLTNTVCINCDQNAWAWFQQPSTAWRGWFGGCGEFDCTGPNNYIIHDQDGNFTGKVSQLLANNTMLGNYEKDCTYNEVWNGHYCLTDELGVLQYQSIAPDFNLRIMWPVWLKYDTGAWQSKTNGWRQWQWQGPQPLNRRLARFVSVVKLHQNYNLTYSGQPPSDSRFQIQKRLLPSGNQSDWVIIRIYYPLPNALQVLVKNTTGTDIIVRPFPINNGQGVDLRNHVGVCGANNFHYDNGTIEFVVNGKANCQVRVRLASYVKLTARLSIPVMDFFNNDGVTTFITNVCAFLKIDPGRLKIVGVRNGSAIVEAVLTSPAPALNSSTTATATTTTDEHATLSELASSASSGLSGGLINVGASVLGVSTQVVVLSPNGTVFTPPSTSAPSDSSKLILIICLSAGIPLLILTIAISTYCYIKRKRQRISSVSNESDVVLSDQHHLQQKTSRQTIKVMQLSKMSDTMDKY